MVRLGNLLPRAVSDLARDVLGSHPFPDLMERGVASRPPGKALYDVIDEHIRANGGSLSSRFADREVLPDAPRVIAQHLLDNPVLAAWDERMLALGTLLDLPHVNQKSGERGFIGQGYVDDQVLAQLPKVNSQPFQQWVLQRRASGQEGPIDAVAAKQILAFTQGVDLAKGELLFKALLKDADPKVRDYVLRHVNGGQGFSSSPFSAPRKAVPAKAPVLQPENPLTAAFEALPSLHLEGVSEKASTRALSEEERTVLLAGIPVRVNDRTDLDRAAIPREARANLVMVPTTEDNLRRVAAAADAGLAVLLEGPTSAGKTALVRYMAHKTGSPFRRVSMGPATEEGDLVGRYVGGEARFDAAALDRMSEQELRWVGMEYGVDDFTMPLPTLRKSILETQETARWVDGVVVKAMKRGETLLLDELNLAEPGVIERLNSLFGDDPRLVLSEHLGEVVRPDKNFRMFATMNPTSYGSNRKELSKPLLDRFTRVVTQGLSSNELGEILKAKFGEALPTTQRARLVVFHDHVARLADTGEIGANLGGVAYSLRNLERVANRFLRYRGQGLSDDGVLRRELQEVYRDFLNDPADIQSVNDQLDVIAPYDGPSFYDSLKLDETDSDFRIGDVVVSKLNTGHALTPGESARLELVPTTLEGLYRYSKAQDMGENFGFVGEPGIGKTAIPTMYAMLRGMPAYVQQFSRGTDSLQLIGGYGLQGWIDGLLLKAGRFDNVPGVFSADELNMADPGLLERLNSLLDDERKLVLTEKDGEEVPFQRDFSFVASMNPFGAGFGGRNKLSRALQNRLTLWAMPSLSDPKNLAPLLRAKAASTGVDAKAGQALIALHESLMRTDYRERASIRKFKAALQLIRQHQPSLGPSNAFKLAVEVVYEGLAKNPDDALKIREAARTLAGEL